MMIGYILEGLVTARKIGLVSAGGCVGFQHLGALAMAMDVKLTSLDAGNSDRVLPGGHRLTF
jgi:hypothetical protein